MFVGFVGAELVFLSWAEGDGGWLDGIGLVEVHVGGFALEGCGLVKASTGGEVVVNGFAWLWRLVSRWPHQ